MGHGRTQACWAPFRRCRFAKGGQTASCEAKGELRAVQGLIFFLPGARYQPKHPVLQQGARYQRSILCPSRAPTVLMARIAMPYQVVKNSGESSVQ